MPSSGFVAIIMLLPLCDRVTVYGFGVEGMGAKKTDDGYGYHYYKVPALPLRTCPIQSCPHHCLLWYPPSSLVLPSHHCDPYAACPVHGSPSLKAITLRPVYPGTERSALAASAAPLDDTQHVYLNNCPQGVGMRHVGDDVHCFDCEEKVAMPLVSCPTVYWCWDGWGPRMPSCSATPRRFPCPVALPKVTVAVFTGRGMSSPLARAHEFARLLQFRLRLIL